MDERQVHEIAELEVRRYFDSYLQKVFPEQVKALKHHTHRAIEAHDTDDKAHGGIEKKVNRFFWVLLGAAAVTGSGFTALITNLIG